MKLKRICKLEYDANDRAIIPRPWAMRYDVYFIDTEDWLCIDEDDYTQEKIQARRKESIKRFAVYQDNGNGIMKTVYIYTPYIPMHVVDQIVDEMVTIKR